MVVLPLCGRAAKNALHGSRRDAMFFGDLPQTLPTLAALLDGSLIQIERAAADMLAFETSSPHAGPDPLDDQIKCP